MSIEEAILEAVRALPADKQQEVLDHAARLRKESGPMVPCRSVKGLWADLGVSLSAAEIDQAQQELWRDFPMKDI